MSLLNPHQDVGHIDPGQYAPDQSRLWAKVRWLSAPYTVVLISLPMLILMFAPSEYYAGAFLAYINLIISGSLLIYLLKRQSLGSMMPAISIAFFIIVWPLGALYIALLRPDSMYNIGLDFFSTLEPILRVQAVACMFLLGYVPALLALIPRSTPNTLGYQPPLRWTRFAHAMVVVAIGMLFLHAFSMAFPLGALVAYVANGSQKYLVGLFFAVGACWSAYSKKWRMGIILSILPVAAIYTLANSRGAVLRPAAFFFLGFFFLRQIPQYTKVFYFNVVAALGSFYILIGNTTRLILGNKGLDNIGERIQAMGRWQEVVGEESVLDATFGRLHSSSGIHVIRATPEQVPFASVDLVRFIYESAAMILVPGILLERTGFTSEYSSSLSLTKYGMISDQVGINFPMISNLWYLGGFVPVLLGGIMLGLVHGLFVKIVDGIGRRDPIIALYLAAITAHAALLSAHYPLVQHVRQLITFAILGYLFYLFAIKPFINRRSL